MAKLATALKPNQKQHKALNRQMMLAWRYSSCPGLPAYGITESYKFRKGNKQSQVRLDCRTSKLSGIGSSDRVSDVDVGVRSSLKAIATGPTCCCATHSPTRGRPGIKGATARYEGFLSIVEWALDPTKANAEEDMWFETRKGPIHLDLHLACAKYLRS